MTPRVSVGVRVLFLVVAAGGIVTGSASAVGSVPQGLVNSQNSTLAPFKLGTAVVLGRVLRDDNNEPVEASSVCMVGSNLPQFCELTDEKGRFLYRNVPAGSYYVYAEPGALGSGAFGRTRAWGPQQRLEIADGQRLMDLVIRVFPAARLIGQVTDEAGEPVVGARVATLIRTPRVERIGSWLYNWGNAGSTVTDDRGTFSIAAPAGEDYVLLAESQVFASVTPDTPPGDVPLVDHSGRRPVGQTAGPAVMLDDLYLRLASAWRPSAVAPPLKSDGTMLVYPTTFYPSARSVDEAATISVEAGRQYTGLNIGLHPVVARRVSGRVTMDGQPVPGITVSIKPEYATRMNYDNRFETALALADRSGQFVLAGVPAGEYVVRAELTGAATPVDNPAIRGGADDRTITMGLTPTPVRAHADAAYSIRSLTVGEDDCRGVEMELRTGVGVSGVVKFDGKAPPSPTQIQRLTASLRSIGGLPESQEYPHLDAQLRFSTGKYPLGTYALTVGLLNGWTIASAPWNGKDLTTPFEMTEDIDGVVVTFTDRLTSLSGVVSTASGPDRDAYVVVFPANYRSGNAVQDPRLFSGERAGANGNFELPDLRPGDYIAAAIPESLSTHWQTAERLAFLATVGARVTLPAGEKTTKNLQTVRLK